MSSIGVAAALAGVVACGDLQGFGGAQPPLVSFHVEVTGDLAQVQPDTDPVHLRVALIWGRQWVIEPLCILPPESDAAAAVIAAGCRDPFGFVPARVATTVPVDVGTPAQVDLFTLPAADVMVGDVTARVAYGSFVVYDDRNGDHTLNLARPNRAPGAGPGGGGGGSGSGSDTTPIDQPDRVYGGSFISMTKPDVRVAYREGAFNQAAAFYPRAGCADPAKGFSVLGAGGFSYLDAIKATQMGTLPQEDPASCTQELPADAQVTVPLQSPSMLAIKELACTERLTDSTVRYQKPPSDPPDFTDRVTACVHTPTFSSTPSDTIELVVSGRSTDACVGLTHYVLKGCSTGPTCASPTWDLTATPPAWWPCP